MNFKLKVFLSCVELIFIFTFTFAKLLKFAFLPNFDTTQVYVSGSVGVGHDLEETESIVQKLEKKLLAGFYTMWKLHEMDATGTS